MYGSRRVLVIATCASMSVLLTGPCSFGGNLFGWGGGQSNWVSLADAVRISSAPDHSLALRSDGSLVAWGYNFSGQCDVPGGLGPVKEIAAGSYFSVAIKMDGSVAAWGSNDYGQTNVPEGLSDVMAISAGHAHCLALRSNRTVVAWGSDGFGQSTIPNDLANVTAVCAAWNQSLALRADGTVVAWGLNDSGQSQVPPGLTDVKAIAANLGYSLALRDDGTVAMWGQGPNLPAGLSNIVAIAAGETHALALNGAGVVVTWGEDHSGETLVPVAVRDAEAIAGGWNFSAAITRQGIVLLNPRKQADWFTVSIASESGKSYALEYRDTSGMGLWNSLPAVAGTGGMLDLTDSSARGPLRIYRVRAQ